MLLTDMGNIICCNCSQRSHGVLIAWLPDGFNNRTSIALCDQCAKQLKNLLTQRSSAILAGMIDAAMEE